MCGIDRDLVLASESNFTCALREGRNRPRLCVRAENYLVLIYGAKMTWYLALESKLTCFSYAGRKSLGFSVSIEVDFVFACVVYIDFIS